jgi:hypothetical protein
MLLFGRAGKEPGVYIHRGLLTVNVNILLMTTMLTDATNSLYGRTGAEKTGERGKPTVLAGNI